MAQQYKDVQFEFLNAKNAEFVIGLVLVREGEMVINIPPEGAPTYLVVGKQRENQFVGASKSLAGLDGPKVYARWSRLGASWVGTWREDAEEFLFKFTLPDQGVEVAELEARLVGAEASEIAAEVFDEDESARYLRQGGALVKSARLTVQRRLRRQLAKEAGPRFERLSVEQYAAAIADLISDGAYWEVLTLATKEVEFARSRIAEIRKKPRRKSPKR